MTNPVPEHRADTPNAWISDPAVRKAIYGIVVAIGAALVVFGLVTQDQVTMWLQVVGNVIMVGTGSLALVNTPKKV